MQSRIPEGDVEKENFECENANNDPEHIGSEPIGIREHFTKENRCQTEPDKGQSGASEGLVDVIESVKSFKIKNEKRKPSHDPEADPTKKRLTEPRFDIVLLRDQP